MENERLPEHIRALYGHSIFDAGINTIVRSPRSRFESIGSDKFISAAGGVFGGLMVFIFPYIDKSLHPNREVEIAAYQSAQTAKASAQRQAVEKDYAETAGANIFKAEDGTSYVITLRDSASIAGDRNTWFSHVLGRIGEMSGCTPTGSSFTPGNDSKNNPWRLPTVDTYIIFTSCDNANIPPR